MHKRYDKIYFYPISKSVFLNILSKDKLIILIKEADLILNENIELVYFDKNQKMIRIFWIFYVTPTQTNTNKCT